MYEKEEGFTLVELMIVIAVVAILATVGLPSLREFIQNNRLAAQSNDLLTSLSVARSEALKHGRPVTLCRSANGTSCGGGWADGWIMFLDGATASGAAPAVAELLRIHEPLSGDTVLAGPDWLRYLPSGRVDGSAQCFQLALPDAGDDDDKKRSIRIAATGRAAVEHGGCPS